MTATTGFERDNQGLFIRKDPEAVMNYTVDYSTFLESGDSIASQTTTVDAGMTVDSSSIVSGNKKVTMKLSSGVVGTAYTVKITAVSNDGLTFVHRFKIKCENIHL
tara:strand:- start:267 stop:584 length:318 start_codon:yes stop_codon:yes gene_type:complete